MVGIRPSTLRGFKRKNAKVSSLHVSIARMSYLKDHAKMTEAEKPWFHIQKRTQYQRHIEEV